MHDGVENRGPQDEEGASLREWFDAGGWKLEAKELRAELRDRGADGDTVIELLDEGADRRRRQPAALAERSPDGRVGSSSPASRVEPALGATAPGGTLARSASGELAPVVPITPGNVPPQNKEAEEHVLGSMLIAPGAIASCSEILTPDGSEFYYHSHAKIYRAALSLDEKGEPVDAITLTDALEQSGELEAVGGRVRLHELAALVPASANAPHYARIVKETATLRGLIRAGGEITRLGWDRPGETGELVDQAESIVFDLAQGRTGEERTEHVSIAVKETFKRLAERAESGNEHVGVPSGLHDLDAITSGFEAGNLVLLAARPSMGKSALLHTILANISIRQQLPVCLFTAEMSKTEVVQRLLAREARVDGKRIRNAKFLEGDWARLAKASETLTNAPFYHDDSGQFGLAYVRRISRRMKQRHPDLALVAVDYIQLMSGEGENRNAEISVISRGLKMLAREIEVPVLALSQLNRAVEQRADKRPVLSDLRDSGSLEQDADLVAFLYRDEYYNEGSDQQGVAEVNLAKHRNGPTGMAKLAFQSNYAAFGDLARGY